MVLVFIDMLGVRDKWAKKGREGAEDAFIRFRNLIAHSLREIPPAEIEKGIIETDAFVLICKTMESALKFAKKMYVDAFLQTEKNENNRIWLRGVIIPQKENSQLRWEKSLNKPYDHVNLVLYSNDLFDAIALEKSGIKGMRILVDKDLVTAQVRTNSLIKVGPFNFLTIKKLKNSLYPSQLGDNYMDYLWMSDSDENENTRFERNMALRLRKASQNGDEFIQGAATQLLFHEYSAMIGSLRKRFYMQTQKKLKKVTK